MTGTLRKGEIWRQTCSQTECYVKIGVMLPQVKEHQRLLANHKKLEDTKQILTIRGEQYDKGKISVLWVKETQRRRT